VVKKKFTGRIIKRRNMEKIAIGIAIESAKGG
jgi:hypothetical protein